MDQQHNHTGDHDRHRSSSFSRVHFPQNQVTAEHSGQLTVNVSPDKEHIDAHVGFLLTHHRYQITVPVPFYLGDSVKPIEAHPNMKLIESKSDKDKTAHMLVIELKAFQDGLLSADLCVQGSNTDAPTVLSITGRSIGAGKGTPALKLGVKCIGNESPETEFSEGDVLKGRVEGSVD